MLFVAVLGQTALPSMNAGEVWSTLQKAGFQVKPSGEGANGIGILTSEELSVDVSFRMWHRGPRDTQPIVKDVYLTHRYRPFKKVSPLFTQGWQYDQNREGADTIGVSAKLSGMIQADTAISLESGMTDLKLKSRVEGFLRGIRKLHRDVPEGQAGAPPFKLDEGQKVDALGWEDMQYLTDSWGWTYQGATGFSGPTWVHAMKIDGMLIYVQPAHPGVLIRDRLLVSACAKGKFSDPDKLAMDIQKKTPNCSVSVSAELVGFQTPVDLSGGMSISDLKKRLSAFSREIAPWIKGKQGL